MDPYRSYYPDQFLEETSDLLNLDPSQLSDDEDFNAPAFANGTPPPPATPYGLEAYFAAAGLASAPAPTYFVNGNLPSSASGANGSHYSSADGNSAPAPSWGDPSFNPPNPQTSAAQSTLLDPNSPALGYLTPELLQMLLPVDQPQQPENSPSGSDPYPPETRDWREPNQGPAMSAAAFEASQASRSIGNGDSVYLDDGNNPPPPRSASISGGQISPIHSTSELASGYWPRSADPTLSAQASSPTVPGQSAPSSFDPVASGYAKAVGNLPLSDFHVPIWPDGNIDNPGSDSASSFPFGGSSGSQPAADVPNGPRAEAPPPASGSDAAPLKVLNLNGRQMIATATGFVPLDDLLPPPPPDASEPVNLDVLHERMRAFARQNQAAPQGPPMLSTALAEARQRTAASNPTEDAPQLSRLQNAGASFVQSALRAGATLPQAFEKLDEMIAEQSPGWEDPRTLALRQRFYSGLPQRIAQSFPEDPRHRGEFLAHTLPSLVGGLAPLVASNMAGRALGAGELAGALPTSATLSLQEAQSEYERAIAAGAVEDVARKAFGFGAALGAFSGFGLGRIGGAGPSAALEGSAGNTLARNGLASLLRQANAGGGAMVYNRLGELADAHGITGFDHSSEQPSQVFRDLAEAYAQGALVSSFLHPWEVRPEHNVSEPRWEFPDQFAKPGFSDPYSTAPGPFSPPVATMMRPIRGSTDAGAIPPPPDALVAGMKQLELKAIANSLRASLDAPEAAVPAAPSGIAPEKEDQLLETPGTQQPATGKPTTQTPVALNPLEVHARLKAHMDAALAQVDAEDLTKAQRDSLVANPRLAKAHRGTQIDTIFKKLVDADPFLSHLVVTPRFTPGPDAFDPVTQEWWDVTTQKEWQDHLKKYWLFGRAYPLFTD